MDLIGSSLSRKRERKEAEVDRISALPEHLLHHILSFLPTKLAVETSLLSSRWRNLWATTPALNFDINEPFQRYASSLSLLRFAHLTLRHRDPTAPLRSFRLSIGRRRYADAPVEGSDVVALVGRAAEYGIHEFRIQLSGVREPMLPPSIFTLASLRVLALIDASLFWPPSASLPFLEILNLSDVDVVFDGDAAPDFISRSCPRLKRCRMHMCHVQSSEFKMECPLLEVLHLDVLFGVERIRIAGERLKTLRITESGLVKELLISTPNLELFRWANLPPHRVSMQRPMASLSSTYIDLYDHKPCSPDAFAGAAALVLGVLDSRRLDIMCSRNVRLGFEFLTPRANKIDMLQLLGEGLLKGHIKHQPAPTYSSGIQHLCLRFQFGTLNVLGVAFLLKFAANLNTLEIYSETSCASGDDEFGPHFITRAFGPGGFWESQGLPLERLSTVRMFEAEGTPYEIDFVEFLLRTVTALRELTIEMPETAACVDWLKIRKTPRASSNVKICLFRSSRFR